MSSIVLATLNARYIHSSLGLRYLRANLGALRDDSEIVEFTIDRKPIEVVTTLLERSPRIVGLGVYIWNIRETTEVVGLLKRVRPEVRVIIGGPEVSFEIDEQPIARLADHIVTNEGDLAFADLCRRILAGETSLPKVIDGGAPPLADVRMPYEEYTDEDVAHRIVYVEASRGCPFECEFCLSALDVPVRAFELDAFLLAMDALFRRGVRHFKFVDRTFNLNLAVARRILEFFLERMEPGLFLHFEMIPDRFPDGLRALIRRFPEGSVQFEVGIQTFDDSVGRNISRRQDTAKLADNLRFLREETNVHVHADLIVGLPGETVASFAEGFDRLVALGPHEIQVGILKRLRGTPIVRHDAAYGMTYSPYPPYEILANRDMDFETMQRLVRFAKVHDLVANSGHFTDALALLFATGPSPFGILSDVADRLQDRFKRTHAIALPRLSEFVFDELRRRGIDASTAAKALWSDWRRGGRSDRPPFLEPFVEALPRGQALAQRSADKRQRRHRAGAGSEGGSDLE